MISALIIVFLICTVIYLVFKMDELRSNSQIREVDLQYAYKGWAEAVKREARLNKELSLIQAWKASITGENS